MILKTILINFILFLTLILPSILGIQLIVPQTHLPNLQILSLASFFIIIGIAFEKLKNKFTSKLYKHLFNDYNYKPSTTIEYGIDRFVDWYLEYYKVS